MPHDSQQAVLGDRAGRERLVPDLSKPLVNRVVLNVRGIDERNEDVHVQQIVDQRLFRRSRRSFFLRPQEPYPRGLGAPKIFLAS